ncbi:MAG: YlbF family regulator [Bacillota bacterium]
MTVLAKALELGAAISQCEELKKVREAEQAMFTNPDARALIEEFQNYQRQVEFARSKGVQPGADLYETLRSVRNRMNENQLISDYFAAQEELNQILRQINQILNHAITGGGGCTPDGCSTCGGSCGD